MIESINLAGTSQGGAATDEKAKVSDNDTTAGFLNGKLVAGTNVTLTENNNGGDETLTISAAGGVTGFIGSQNTASPNNTVNASRLLVDATSTNADFVIQPKGSGAILARLPDNNTGGNKRGAYAVDLAVFRNSNTSVASGLFSFIGSGSDNRASGEYSVVVGGINCTASSNYSIVIGGIGNSASALYALAGGNACTASGTSALAFGTSCTASASRAVALGESTTASALYAIALGASTSATAESSFSIGRNSLADRYGMFACASGRFAINGDFQYERYTLRRATTDATPTILSCNGAAPASSTRIGIASDATYTFRAMVTARRTDADNESAGWEVKGVIDNNAGTTALVGSVTVTAIGDDSAGTWTVAVTADNTNDALQFEVTGEAGKTIRWGAVVELMKVGG